jgi:probable rRNA maturation factor
MITFQVWVKMIRVMEVNVLIEEGLEVTLDPARLQWILEKTLLFENVPANIELSLIITGQDRIQELNREYRGKDQPTDVLSFTMSEKKDGGEEVAFITPPDGLLHLGEVIISYPQALFQAGEHGHSIDKEAAILIVHGVLHILGYDHDISDQAAVMETREKEILAALDKEAE